LALGLPQHHEFVEGRVRIEFNVIDDLKRVQLAEERVELAIAVITTTQ
tara:strand:+ start:357 stop:500 length:144 start_codon:yes stop_codon:yes gene_type:complete